jgi:hypothetical protein
MFIENTFQGLQLLHVFEVIVNDKAKTLQVFYEGENALEVNHFRQKMVMYNKYDNVY